MAQDLSQYGVVPRKTDKVFLPEINNNLMPHLIRGMIDGDGCISINSLTNKLQISFCGNKRCVTEFRDFLVYQLDISYNKVI